MQDLDITSSWQPNEPPMPQAADNADLYSIADINEGAEFNYDWDHATTPSYETVTTA